MKRKYIIRLDDACPKRDIKKWDRIEEILDHFNIKPLVGIIPNCEDLMMDKYEEDVCFWKRVHIWEKKEWTIAMHGYNHIYSTKSGGINPVNKRSEFADEKIEVQKLKITKGIEIMNKYGFNPKVFFAPSHTFDENTLLAIKECSNIKFISDTIAYDSYIKDGLTFVPQQSGRLRCLPFKISTFCLHPNTMNEEDFEDAMNFFKRNSNKFSPFITIQSNRKLNAFDKTLQWLYFNRNKFIPS